MADIKKIAEELISLSTKEAIELSRVLKEEYGIEPKYPQLKEPTQEEQDKFIESLFKRNKTIRVV